MEYFVVGAGTYGETGRASLQLTSCRWQKKYCGENLKYFQRLCRPVKNGLKMAIHMDDPPWDIFRTSASSDPRRKILTVFKDELTFFVQSIWHCAQGLECRPEKQCAILSAHCDRIAFQHIRTNIFRMDVTVMRIPELYYFKVYSWLVIWGLVSAWTTTSPGMKSRAMSVKLRARPIVHRVLCIVHACADMLDKLDENK